MLGLTSKIAEDSINFVYDDKINPNSPAYKELQDLMEDRKYLEKRMQNIENNYKVGDIYRNETQYLEAKNKVQESINSVMNRIQQITGDVKSTTVKGYKYDADPKATDLKPKTNLGDANIVLADSRWGQLSNLADHTFTYEGREYRSVEHAYQANKSGEFHEPTYRAYFDKPEARKINTGPSANQKTNIKLMEDLYRQMLSENPDMVELLKETEGFNITHQLKKTDIWTTEMPKILTKLRDEFDNVTPEVKPVQRVGNWTRAEVEADKDFTYLFGDNTADRSSGVVPTKTQAVIRGLDNAVGIDTRLSRTEDWVDNDANYNKFTQHVDEQIQKALSMGKPIKVSAGGMGTGMAKALPPRFKEYLDNAIKNIGTVDSEFPLTEIISGMQKNVDQYGIEAAKILGLDYGGTVNKGFKVVPEGSNSPNFQEFVDSGKWEEVESQYYPDRTKANAQNADGTVWFGEGDSTGYGATKRSSGDKPWIENPTDVELRQWIIDNNIKTLNVAGNRSYGTEELGEAARDTIVKAVRGNETPEVKQSLPDNVVESTEDFRKMFNRYGPGGMPPMDTPEFATWYEKEIEGKSSTEIIDDIAKNADVESSLLRKTMGEIPGFLVVPLEAGIEVALRYGRIAKANPRLAKYARRFIMYELAMFAAAAVTGVVTYGANKFRAETGFDSREIYTPYSYKSTDEANQKMEEAVAYNAEIQKIFDEYPELKEYNEAMAHEFAMAQATENMDFFIKKMPTYYIDELLFEYVPELKEAREQYIDKKFFSEGGWRASLAQPQLYELAVEGIINAMIEGGKRMNTSYGR